MLPQTDRLVSPRRVATQRRARVEACTSACEGLRQAWLMRLLHCLRRFKAGELNTAELGMANMQQAIKDPTAMREMAQMMQDPESQKEIRKMMADPGFQQQAKRMMEQMKASGSMPDVAKLMQDPQVMAKAQAMAQAMGVGGAGGGGMGGMGGDSTEAEIARLRAENAALKGQRMA
mmetsp:Transcript_24348/g.55416  ORF Transcript_24348/g.55416 Transcript_24348/m.55416 type:complete len:176 (-) Transcript_24348:309-836(-)